MASLDKLKMLSLICFGIKDWGNTEIFIFAISWLVGFLNGLGLMIWFGNGLRLF